MTTEALIVELLGCEWGRAVFSHHDTTLCRAQAVQRIAIHSGPGEPTLIQLCGRHRDIVLAETDPRSAP